MNKKILLLIPSIFLVAACSSTGGKEEPHTHVDNQPKDHKCDICGIKLTNHIDQTGDDYCDICGEYMGNPDDPEACDKDDDVCRAEKSGSVAENTPKYPFYLKVGEQKKLKTKMKDSSIIEEKYFNWENQDPEHIELKIDEKDGNTAYVTAKVAPAEGFSKIKVINKAAPSVTGEFNAKVIDFDDVNEYLWQCGDTVDRKPFGYVSTKENPAGVQSGVAQLGNISWEFNRSAVRALNSGNGALAFGKGKAPESISLKAVNTRKVKQIVVEHASANSLAKLTVSVGATTFAPVTAPKPVNSKLTYSTIDCSNAKGDIKLSWETPEYDPSREGEADYKAPGATYLKSIRIIYEVEECLGIKISENSLDDNVFVEWDEFSTEGLLVKRITESGEYPIPLSALQIDVPEFDDTIETETINVSYQASNGTFETSYEVYLGDGLYYKEGEQNPQITKYVEYSNFNPLGISILLKDRERNAAKDVTDRIKWAQSDKINPSTGKATNLYLDKGATKVTGFLEGRMDLGSFVVTIEPVAEITKLVVPEGSKPKTTTYIDGSPFSYAGLKVLGYAADESIEPAEIQSKMKFYDGKSVENNPEDPTQWSESLAVGTTNVVGVLPDHEINNVIIEDIKVLDVDRMEVRKQPNVTVYADGEDFKYGGVEIYAISKDETVDPLKISNDQFNFYDGVKYDADPQVKTKKMSLGTTYVVAEYKKNTAVKAKIEGIEVLSFTSLTVEGTASTLSYNSGDKFDATGLTINAILGDNRRIDNVTSKVTWYDGPSYDADPQVKTENLVAGSTYVYAVYGDLKVKVEGLTVTDLKHELTLVKSASDIVDGARYLVVAKATEGYVCVDGTRTSGLVDNPKAMPTEFALNDSIELAHDYYLCNFVITLDGSLATIRNDAGFYIGMSSTNVSMTKTAANKQASYIVDEETHAVKFSYTFEKDGSPKTLVLGFNTSTGKFNGTASGYGEIYLYKFAK